MKQWWLKFKAPHLKGVKITVREKEPTKELADVCTIIPVVSKDDYNKLEARCKELEKELSEAKRDAFNWQCRAIDTKCSLVDAEQTIERAEKSTDAVLILRKYLERKKNA